MTPDEVSKLLKQVQRGNLHSLLHYCITGLIALVAAAVGAYFVTRAENVATKKDLGEITRIAEEIRADVSDASWQSQRFWEEKKLLYVQVIGSLNQLSLDLIECELNTAGVSLDDKLQTRTLRVLDRVKQTLSDFSNKSAVAVIFLSEDAQNALLHLKTETKKIPLDDPARGPDPAVKICRAMRTAVNETHAKVVSAARADLSAKLGY